MCTWGYRRVPIKCEWSIRTRTAGTHSKLLHVQLHRHLSPLDVSMNANLYDIALEYTCSCHVQVNGSSLNGEHLDGELYERELGSHNMLNLDEKGTLLSAALR